MESSLAMFCLPFFIIYNMIIIVRCMVDFEVGGGFFR